MDLKEIRQLIKMVESSDISQFEIQEEGKKLKITKNSHSSAQVVQHTVAPPAPAAAAPAPAAPEQAAPAPAKKDNVVEVLSPMVGTFYRSPSPDSDPYTDVGKTVKAGDVLCIVEAMKLMNEIESEVSGKVVEICVENGEPVEYNQVLFRVEKAG